MQLFFPTLDALNSHTASLCTLSEHPESACQHCSSSDNWVSHGYIYKQRAHPNAQPVGKRIVCCRRYGKTGCGKTRQLYLEHIIPGRCYDMHVLVAFFIAWLVHGKSVGEAYYTATQSAREERQAWRWIRSIFYNLSTLRSLASHEPSTVHTPYINVNVSRVRHILYSTLHTLANPLDGLLHFQSTYQRPFL